MSLLLSTRPTSQPAQRQGVPRGNASVSRVAAVLALLAVSSVSRASAQTIVRDSSVRQLGTANTIAWLDAGAARSKQLERDAALAGTLGVGIRRATARSVVHGDAAALVGSDSISAVQLLGAFAVSPFSSGLLVTELTAGVSRFRPDDDVAEGSRFAQVRQQLRRAIGPLSMGLSVDAGIGKTRRPEKLFWNAAHGLTGWMARRDVGLTGRWQRLRSNDFPIAEAAGFYISRDASAYDVDHFSAVASYQRAKLQLQATIERQQGRSATVGHATAFSAAAGFDVARGVSLVASAGKQLSDPLRGYPKANYSSLAVRYTYGLSGTAPSRSTVVVEREAWLELPPVTGGILLVQVRAPENAVVEVADSHSHWTPTRLERVGNIFAGRIVLPSGTHRVAIRINRGEWRAPKGLARVVDDLGGEVGLVVVP